MNKWEPFFGFIVALAVLCVVIIASMFVDNNGEKIKQKEREKFIECTKKTDDHLWCFDLHYHE